MNVLWSTANRRRIKLGWLTSNISQPMKAPPHQKKNPNRKNKPADPTVKPTTTTQIHMIKATTPIIEHAGRNPSRTHNSYERTPIELQFIGHQRDEQSIIRRNPSHTNASSTTAEGHQRDEPSIIPLHQSHTNASSTTAERRQRDKQSIILQNRSPTNDNSTAANDSNDGSTRRPVRPEEGTPSHTRISVTTSFLPLSLVYGHHHQANKAPSTNSMLDKSPRISHLSPQGLSWFDNYSQQSHRLGVSHALLMQRQLDAASTISRNTFSTTHLAQCNVDDPLKEKHGTHHAMISQSMSAAFHDSRSIPSKTAIIHTTSPRGLRPNQVLSETDPGFTDSATNRSMRKAPLRSNNASDMSTPNPTSETTSHQQHLVVIAPTQLPKLHIGPATSYTHTITTMPSGALAFATPMLETCPQNFTSPKKYFSRYKDAKTRSNDPRTKNTTQ